ncbi:MAG: ABC transporter substrate-binding protein [Betaproteobacteria bacterium]|nr:ABC transporter substrate-binding protein [Betaproteobacteria bacterium]
MNRRDTVLALLALGVAPLASLAQQQGKVYRIGFLGLANASAQGNPARLEAIREGLRALGYVEGKNIVIEFRWAEGKYERLPDLAAELVRLKVDAILTQATPATRAAMQVTKSIPIVTTAVADPVTAGLVGSLARPEGNLTGTSVFTAELSAKRLELLREFLPRAKRVGVLLHPENASMAMIFESMEAAARSLKLEVHSIPLRGPEEIEGAFGAMRARKIDALVVLEDPILIAISRTIAEYATKAKLPSSGYVGFADQGGLMDYGVNLVATYRRAAYFVDKILKGARPAELPFERATVFEMTVNLKTAKTLGIKVPPSIAVRADRVIE